jgi:hypothetical protein
VVQVRNRDGGRGKVVLRILDQCRVEVGNMKGSERRCQPQRGGDGIAAVAVVVVVDEGGFVAVACGL